MFQFPGFALKTLCIQVLSTCLNPILSIRDNNMKLSGGLPHSEIHGSKLILSSPWLIAEYHVFHRLLLPRHSPNALLALDLIQKKKDLRQSRRRKLVRNRCHSSEPKAYFPSSSDVDWMNEYASLRTRGLVYLTWTTLFVSAGIQKDKRGSTRLTAFHRGGTELRSSPHWRDQTVLIVILRLVSE